MTSSAPPSRPILLGQKHRAESQTLKNPGNVAFDEFQSIYLEPEKEDEKKRGASTLLALGENVGQAV